ncbi:MAG TPA: murein biosynthesis integral membrane protein MurJ [Spirochaetota bacterium]|nr:murein biosynthesis integral membrane protein MurJ [Spirochaetota bacterium]HOM09863.1 murein biosynthesis integral membrane protein MurJ [Spirochaetota bacterium]HPP49754.1 murein biosynthesis integral membrane protein MurJ [Spirochaetota bacterium]HXK65024.1 murein biosynthesis integral membrane protein MurJ [Spirochaetota bacterium]
MKTESKDKSLFNTVMVATGIFLSRIAGLIRDRVFAHYFGNSDAADAFRAAFRIPNFLQNLFGEGVLSASFIPVYAKLLAEKKFDQATKLARSIAGILSLVISSLVFVGILITPLLIDIIAPGFQGEKRELTILLVRIFFPGAGILVFSAWCLGILNSHGKFFLSYSAPVFWNLIIIITLLFFGDSSTQNDLATYTAAGSVVGSLMQVLIQLPFVLTIVKNVTLRFDTQSREVRTVIKNFIPVFFSRGVVQVSAYVDSLLASLLPTGAVAALSYAQTLYMLPISLFGMSVSAAELPSMSKVIGPQEEIASKLRNRINNSIKRIAFYIVPSTVAFFALGDILVGAIYQTGKFTTHDTFFVWMVLAGSTIGLLAITQSRLYSSAYYAMNDTRTPLKFAIIRVLLTSVTGYYASQYGPLLFHIDMVYGTVGLTITAGLSGWVEYKMLQVSISRKIGTVGLEKKYLFYLWTSALIAATIAFFIKINLHYHPLILAVTLLPLYGVLYFFFAFIFRIEEIMNILKMVGFKK